MQSGKRNKNKTRKNRTKAQGGNICHEDVYKRQVVEAVAAAVVLDALLDQNTDHI